ncbi:hypothetical protein PIB30_093003, partial [Stylosanthes scabra]|nr:hypothetical protein [Stylosanthes scabra]
DSTAWSLIPRGNDTYFTVVILERSDALADFHYQTLAFVPRGNKSPTDTYYSRWSAVAVSRALILLTPRRPRLTV